jgi:hypothetical protein
MPSRAVTLGIVVIWLAAVGWMGYREWWRDSGQPPLLDRTDEVGKQTAVWRVHLDGEDVGSVRLSIQRDQGSRLFTLAAEYRPKKDKIRFPGLAVEGLDTVYRATPRGELREVRLNVQFGKNVETWFCGRLDGSQFTGTVRRAGAAGGEALEADAPGGLVNLLQPLHRMPGLYEGRSWQAAVFNPLALARGPQGRGWPPRVVQAQAVADRLTWHEQPVACWRVEYREGDAVLGRLWVRIEDAQVLRQEVEDSSTQIALERELLAGHTLPGLGREPR